MIDEAKMLLAIARLRVAVDALDLAIEPDKPARQYDVGMVLRLKSAPEMTVRLTGAYGSAWWAIVTSGKNTGAAWCMGREVLDAEWEPAPAEKPAETVAIPKARYDALMDLVGWAKESITWFPVRTAENKIRADFVAERDAILALLDKGVKP